MQGQQFKDLFSHQSQDYAKFRPTYPRELFEYIGSICPQRQKAWDCGTGNGQAAIELSKLFTHVYATDPSEKQIQLATPASNITYAVEKAESTQLPDHSVDVITVAQAFHWFDHQKFAHECKRVGKPHSHLVVWSYALAVITPEVDRAVMNLYQNILGPYWEKERSHVEDGYKRVVMPFQELKAPSFSMQADWTFEHLIGYLGTWSALQSSIRINGENPLEREFEHFKTAWGSAPIHKVSWPLTIRVWRIE